MKYRCRASDAGSVEADCRSRSSISYSFFFANRVVGAVVCTQIDAASASRSGQGIQIDPTRAPRSAQGSQIEPARAPRSAQGSEIEPAKPHIIL